MDNRDNRNGPGLLFILLLLAVMLGTVWLSIHQTFAAWQKPPPTKEDYLRSLRGYYRLTDWMACLIQPGLPLRWQA